MGWSADGGAAGAHAAGAAGAQGGQGARRGSGAGAGSSGSKGKGRRGEGQGGGLDLARQGGAVSDVAGWAAGEEGGAGGAGERAPDGAGAGGGGGARVRVHRKYERQAADELTFRPGDLIEVCARLSGRLASRLRNPHEPLRFFAAWLAECLDGLTVPRHSDSPPPPPPYRSPYASPYRTPPHPPLLPDRRTGPPRFRPASPARARPRVTARGAGRAAQVLEADASGWSRGVLVRSGLAPPPPPSLPYWTRLVPPPVLTGRVSSLGLAGWFPTNYTAPLHLADDL